MKKFGIILAHFYFLFIFGLLFLVLLNLIIIALRIIGIISLVLTFIYIYKILKGGRNDSSRTKIIVRYNVPPANGKENVPIDIEGSNNR